MDNIILISQNVKLPSLDRLKDYLVPGDVLIVSTQYVFENEVEIIDRTIGRRCKYVDFADLLSDAEREKCDKEAFDKNLRGVGSYYDRIKTIKNDRIIENLKRDYPLNNCLMVCDDLGIDGDRWISNGFKYVECEYYHNPTFNSASFGKIRRIISLIKSQFSLISQYYKGIIWKSSFKGRKHLFFGSTNRIGYRMDLEFKEASKWENIKFIIQYYSIKVFGYMPKNNTVRMTTFHEDSHWSLPDHPNFNVKKIQDGYLPPNYTSNYLYFFGPRTEFYTWDTIGRHTFHYHGLNSSIMPFRKKLYLPKPNYPQKVKRVLCVASGAGDWTAIKNRSDEDMMLWAFGKVAAMFPDIEFIYRCHPVWVHPQHQGVNSIQRAAEYYDWLKLPNLKLSGNIPNANQDGQFVLSYKRSSFEEDLTDVDIVFGEHSVSMLDAGFKNIILASCNVTGHRNFWEDITKLGFPHCESIDEIANLIRSVTTEEFKQSYDNAIANYNEMTDKEE